MEHKNECEEIKILHQIMTSEEYQLNRRYKRKFCSIFKLVARITIISRKVILYLAFIQVFIFTIIAYFDLEMNFSIIIMSIWLVVLFISFYYMTTAFFTCSIYTYLISLYMKYRFRQVQDMIETYLQTGNIFQTIPNINNDHIYHFYANIKYKYSITFLYGMFRYISLNLQ